MKAPNWVWLAGLAGVGYVAWKFSGEIRDFFDSLKKGASLVTKPVSDALADSIIANDPYLSQPTVQSQLTGAVLFTNGARIPMTQLSVQPYNGPSGFEARVTYQGRTYRLAPHDANGNYPAVPI
jgi:hypothetical protein